MENLITEPSSNVAPIAIIAGNGVLPVEAATALVAQGLPVFVIAIEGEAGPQVEQFDHIYLKQEKVGQIFKVLRERAVKKVLFAGGILRRQGIDWRKLDWGAVRTLPDILGILYAGDNTILIGVIEVFRKRGFVVTGIGEMLPQLLVKPGLNVARKPTASDLKRLIQGAEVTKALGAYDIGQAAVVVGERAVAVEGVEGTDAMLERVVHLREIGRLPSKRGGVLVKCLKPGQDERADLPTIGPDTIENCYKAKLNGIGVEAGKSLIVERERTFALARKHNIFIFGLEL